MTKEEKITTEDKLRIVESYLKGDVGVREAGRQIGVAEATIRRWASRYRAEGPTGLIPNKGNRHYSKETKQAAVMDYQGGGGSLLQVCERYKIRSTRQLQKWIKVYNRHEDFVEQNGGSRMTKSRKTTQAERLEIVRECIAEGNNYGAMAIKYQVSYQQVYSWTKKYREMGEAGLEDRRGRRAGTQPSRTPEEELRDRIAQLERKNLDLEMENALLKKVEEIERRRR